MYVPLLFFDRCCSQISSCVMFGKSNAGTSSHTTVCNLFESALEYRKLSREIYTYMSENTIMFEHTKIVCRRMFVYLCVVCRALSDISMFVCGSVVPIQSMHVVVNGLCVFVWCVSISSMKGAEYFMDIYLYIYIYIVWCFSFSFGGFVYASNGQQSVFLEMSPCACVYILLSLTLFLSFSYTFVHIFVVRPIIYFQIFNMFIGHTIHLFTFEKIFISFMYVNFRYLTTRVNNTNVVDLPLACFTPIFGDRIHTLRVLQCAKTHTHIRHTNAPYSIYIGTVIHSHSHIKRQMDREEEREREKERMAE